MKQKLLLLMLLFNGSLMSQDILGEYAFHRQEMVAAFNFLSSGRFEFYFSYGAVDRTASGTFTVKSDTVELVSDKKAGQDFTISRQSRKGTGYFIQFQDKNEYLLGNIRCMFMTGNQIHEEITDAKGEIRADLPACDKIYVQHLLFPDIVTEIKNEKDSSNYFVLTLNPSLAQVSFKGIDLLVRDDGTLTCLPNYFMEMENIEFTRRNASTHNK